MSTTRKQLPITELLMPGRKKASRADTEWDSVMVQITLAFVIILGFLVSKGITETKSLIEERKSLIEERERQQAVNQHLVGKVKEFQQTEAGQEREMRIQAQFDLQLQKLLTSWLTLRDRRLFRQLLKQYRRAEWVQLADDMDALPVASSFSELTTEIDRIFPGDATQVSSEELNSLTDQVVAMAGFQSSTAMGLEQLKKIAPGAERLLVDPALLTNDNLMSLRNQIIADLNDERIDLAQIQYDLVEKIAAARRQKLLTLPLDAYPADDDTDPSDVQTNMLERILGQLREQMRLLPETMERIRGSDESQPPVEKN